MENAQLVGLSRQVVLRRQLDMIANNVANVNTNGFKAQTLLFEETRLPKARLDAALRPDRPINFVHDDANIYNLEPGSIIETGNPLDVAVNGAGWFVVQTPQGERFTRDGSFNLNAEGRLVNHQGHPVLSDGGPVDFQPGETGIQIARDGTISSSAGPKGRLRVVDFANPGDVVAAGDNLYTGSNPVPATAGVVQGSIERSNVESVQEIARMIQVTRTYQSVTNWMRDADELRRTAIERLGTLN